jgi:3-deoxy-manno-octulosonate cytidylyltransferase (CMP-KDO synthetase)
MLKKIGDLSLIERVALNINNYDLADIFVATDSKEIADIIRKHNINVLMTDVELNSGTDRVYNCFKQINNTKYKYVINIQGDMPFIAKNSILTMINLLKTQEFNMVTAAIKIGEATAEDPNNVKIVKSKSGKALYFSRSKIPYNAKEYLYHVGIYGFTANGLRDFCNLEYSSYESSEKLEQLRALENGMDIGISVIKELPISIDTQEDLEKARIMLLSLNK